jgi:capsular exopolysaccharide synthesis family protein
MDKSLITFFNPKSPESEAYRMLRTNLGYTGVDKKHQVILLTSAKMQEGKSTTVANLAITMAQTGNKVVILDCDLRRPKVHKVFAIDNTVGLSALLTKNIEVSKALYKSDKITNLSIITAGQIPPMPSELLDSKKMAALVLKLREEYDYIIIDSPPVLSVSDATILSRISDAVILVVAANETHVDAVVTAKRSLDKVNANVIGTVLTKAKTGKRGYYYYYDYADTPQKENKFKLGKNTTKVNNKKTKK